MVQQSIEVMTEGARESATVGGFIRSRANACSDAVALAAPDGDHLTFGRLQEQVDQIHAQLRSWGFGPRHRIGLVLPTGPESAVAFLSLAATSVCAPLHPDLCVGELETYMQRLRLDAVVFQPGQASAARQAADSAGIPIIALSSCSVRGAGLFTLEPPEGDVQPLDPGAHPLVDDIAVVMTTSGTTAQPKVVPLTHRNILTSAQWSIRALSLGPDDRCLIGAPLFHIHGMSIVLASLLAGGSVLCPSVFDAPHFFEYLELGSPTWYVASPAIHHLVLAAADDPQYADIIARCPLRFIRSGSASIPPAVIEGLERVFRAPVVEAYGLTEAAPLVACNPLPPGVRKPGSVGMAAGPDVAILDSTGTPVAPGAEGEIVVRGPNVMAGYENDAQANGDAFTREWFRTGDLGYFDHDGYLFVTGRLKELINRGGQIVSPHEIEAVLLQHPDVERAAAFAIPHVGLGEDVAAAVVMRPGADCTPRELVNYASRSLAGFKVPRRVFEVESLPVGPTGKIQRVGLAERLGVTSSIQRVSPHVAPRTQTEAQLACIWKELLSLDGIGVTDDFYDLGGHSLRAVEMLERAGRMRGGYVSLKAFFDQPEATIECLARVLDPPERADHGRRSLLLAVRPEGTKVPFFYLAGDGSYALSLSSRLDRDRPFYILEPHDVFDLPAQLTVEGMARDHLRSLQAVQPQGPYLLGGYSAGGLVAYEMARRLRAQGHRVDLVLLVDAMARNAPLTFLCSLAPWLRLAGLTRDDAFLGLRAFLLARLRLLFLFSRATPAEKRRKVSRRSGRIAGKFIRRSGSPSTPAEEGPPAAPVSPIEWLKAYQRALRAYVPGRYDGCVTFLQAEQGNLRQIDPPTAGWRYVAAQVVTHTVPGTHASCIRDHIDALATTIQECLDASAQD